MNEQTDTIRGTKYLCAKLKYITNLPTSFKNKNKKYMSMCN
jgi:hypothetical protein